MAGFGEILMELRLEAGMTQKELADKLFVSKGTISNYENGIHYPDIEKLTCLADLFQVTTDYLLGRSNTALSVDALGEAVLDDMTAGRLIEIVGGLSEERKQALSTLLKDMSLGTYVDSHG